MYAGLESMENLKVWVSSCLTLSWPQFDIWFHRLDMILLELNKSYKISLVREKMQFNCIVTSG